MSTKSVFDIKNGLMAYFESSNVPLKAYTVDCRKKGDLDIVTVYEAGTRKSVLGYTFGGKVAAEVQVVMHSTSDYRNKVVNSVLSKVPQVSEEGLRRAIESKLAEKVTVPAA
jgi:hypothetical protein